MQRLREFRNAREFDQRSTWLIVGLVILTMIPAFAGYVIAAVEESAWLFVGVFVVTLAVDIAIMVAIRLKQPRRPQRCKG